MGRFGFCFKGRFAPQVIRGNKMEISLRRNEKMEFFFFILGGFWVSRPRPQWFQKGPGRVNWSGSYYSLSKSEAEMEGLCVSHPSTSFFFFFSSSNLWRSTLFCFFAVVCFIFGEISFEWNCSRRERNKREEKKTVFIFQRARNGKGFTLFGLLIPTKMLSDGWLLLLLL